MYIFYHNRKLKFFAIKKILNIITKLEMLKFGIFSPYDSTGMKHICIVATSVICTYTQISYIPLRESAAHICTTTGEKDIHLMSAHTHTHLLFLTHIGEKYICIQGCSRSQWKHKSVMVTVNVWTRTCVLPPSSDVHLPPPLPLMLREVYYLGVGIHHIIIYNMEKEGGGGYR